MKFVFLADPIETWNFYKDTSYMLMLGAQEAGHSVYLLRDGAISAESSHEPFQGQLRFIVEPVELSRDRENAYKLGDSQTMTADEIDAVIIRTDPPFDDNYITNTWLLDQIKDRVFVSNDPTGIRTVNEKIWSFRFARYTPPTLITRSIKEYQKFVGHYENVIVKPTDGFGGIGIFKTSAGDKNKNVIFETVSDGGNKNTIVQQYIPAAVEGDKRILLLGGEILGAVLRYHSSDDHRNNFAAGGKAKPTEITARDREICAALSPFLKELELHFVGIDIIGDYLIEVNVTSPTCLQELNEVSGTNLEQDIIRYMETRAAELKKPV